MVIKSIPMARRDKKSQALPTGWEEVAQALLRNAGLGIYIVQQGNFQYVNPVFQHLTGYTEEELLGKYSLDLVYSEDREMVRKKAIKNLKSENGSIPYEYRLVKKNDKILWVLEEVTSINYGGKRATVGSFMDITARKELEEDIEYSEKRYRTVLDEIGDAYFEVDLNGTLTFVNDQMTQHLHYSKEELLGMNYKTFTAEEEIKNVYEAYNKVYQTGEPSLSLGHRFIRKDGTRGFSDVSISPLKNAKGEIIGFRGISRDISASKRLEEELRVRAQLLDSVTDSILVHDFEGNFVYVNEMACRIHGYSREEFMKMKLHQVIAPDRVSRLDSDFQEMLEKGQMIFESAHLRKDGSIMPAEVHGRTIESGGRKLILTVVRDITERKQAEEALQAEKNKLQSLVDAMEDGLTIQDRDYNIIYHGRLQRTLYGDHLGEKCYRVYEGREKICKGCPVEKAFKDGKSHTADRTSVLPSGEVAFWENTANPIRDASGEIVSCLEISRNITERKKQEQALADEATRRRILVDKSPDGIVVLDVDARVVEANQHFADMLGYTIEEVRKLHTWDWEKNYSHEQILEMGQNVDEKGLHLETKHTRKDGSVIDVDISISGIMYGGRKLIFCIQRDVTERKRSEKEREALLQEMRKINQKLEEANKGLQDFVYIASHDLREPLRKISSFGTLLQDSLKRKLSDDQQENLEFMIDGARRMQDMIDALLTYSRLTTKAKPLEWVDLNKVIEDLKKLELATMLDETHGTIHVPEPLPSVQADLSQMHQLFQNLIGNGLKFRKEGTPPEIIIRAYEIENNMIRIEVEDNGIGIDDKYHSQLFTMFKRLHSREQYEGAGIGLASCKKIVERHGGNIGIKSTLGKGSTFWFTLPRESYLKESKKGLRKGSE